eukprot:TRINITY_DN62054_c0_g1_i1.p1 TRINITY_DN62054_c0_g1~~TRINITY_DN62054_c0_g1_i1.p1  ORF type:complete len:184 (-),score=36.79 TRINITY_DN62054_c0_g1_i1:309-860(-)
MAALEEVPLNHADITESTPVDAATSEKDRGKSKGKGNGESKAKGKGKGESKGKGKGSGKRKGKRAGEPFDVTVVSCAGVELCTLSLEPSCSARQLKYSIFAQTKIKTSLQTLVVGSEVMQEFSRVSSYFEADDCKIVTLVIAEDPNPRLTGERGGLLDDIKRVALRRLIATGQFDEVAPTRRP